MVSVAQKKQLSYWPNNPSAQQKLKRDYFPKMEKRIREFFDDFSSVQANLRFTDPISFEKNIWVFQQELCFAELKTMSKLNYVGSKPNDLDKIINYGAKECKEMDRIANYIYTRKTHKCYKVLNEIYLAAISAYEKVLPALNKTDNVDIDSMQIANDWSNRSDSAILSYLKKSGLITCDESKQEVSITIKGLNVRNVVFQKMLSPNPESIKSKNFIVNYW